jgi:hypothetical protein
VGASPRSERRKPDADPRNGSFNPDSQLKCDSSTHFFVLSYKVGQKPVGADMIDNVLAKDIDGLEPTLTRQGHNAKVLADLLNATRQTTPIIALISRKSRSP